MDFTAQRGYTYAGLTIAHVDAFRQQARYFLEAVQKAGQQYDPERLAWSIPIYVAETDARAREEVEPHLWYFVKRLVPGFSGPGKTWMPPGYSSAEALMQAYQGGQSKAKGRGFAESWEDREKGGSVIVGSPQTVRQRLAEYVKEFKLGNVLAHLQLATLPEELTRKNMDLFAQEVMPYVRKEADQYFATLFGKVRRAVP